MISLWDIMHGWHLPWFTRSSFDIYLPAWYQHIAFNSNFVIYTDILENDVYS